MFGRNGILSRLVVAAFVLCIGTAAHAEKRVALVIGNSAYQAAPKLPNPAGDAKLMSDTLLSLGFFVVGGGAQTDLDKTGFDNALQAFGRELEGADVALFYYAGHGVETHGLNYLVPVDAHPAEEGDVFIQGIGMAGVLDQMDKSGTKINLVLLDACRDNPFRDRGVRSVTGGLAQMQAPPGTLISFATQPRSVALDGDNGHSPYTRALAANMQHQGYGLFRTFNEVGLAVEKVTHGQQLPWVASSPIATSFYFAGRAAPAIQGSQTIQASLTPETNAASSRPSDEALRRDLITDCDRLAAMPYDLGHAASLPGVEVDKMNIPEAAAACNAAMQAYPDVGRFAFEAARVATARKEYPEARRLFEKALAAGYPLAAHNIGVAYESGTGVPMNKAEAARWYKQSAALGEPIAMLDLAWLYQAGEGVAKDCAESIRLNEAAIKGGNPDAMNNLALAYLRGKCISRDYAEAKRLFEQCIPLNNAACMNGLGVIYNDGDGVSRNKRLAHEWFEKSAALGNPEAKQNLRTTRH